MHKFPGWYYGPKGESQVFAKEDDVPKGWHDHPSKHKEKPKSEAEKLNQGTPDQTTGTTPQTGAGGNQTGISPGDMDEIDHDGHKWDASLHAATKSKTTEGSWRMKPGVSRPPAVEGFPKPDAAARANAASSPPPILDL